jgi:hypothetical protein
MLWLLIGAWVVAAIVIVLLFGAIGSLNEPRPLYYEPSYEETIHPGYDQMSEPLLGVPWGGVPEEEDPSENPPWGGTGEDQE